MLRLCIASFCVLLSAACSAQMADDPLGHVTRDARIDTLVARHIRHSEAKDGLDGWRVQLFSGSGTDSRQRGNEIRAEFMRLYPDVPAYLAYQPPNFKVRVGDCRTEMEAFRLKRQLDFAYPQGFVVRDFIKPPRLAIEQESDSIPAKEGTDPLRTE